MFTTLTDSTLWRYIYALSPRLLIEQERLDWLSAFLFSDQALTQKQLAHFGVVQDLPFLPKKFTLSEFKQACQACQDGMRHLNGLCRPEFFDSQHQMLLHQQFALHSKFNQFRLTFRAILLQFKPVSITMVQNGGQFSLNELIFNYEGSHHSLSYPHISPFLSPEILQAWRKKGVIFDRLPLETGQTEHFTPVVNLYELNSYRYLPINELIHRIYETAKDILPQDPLSAENIYGFE